MSFKLGSIWVGLVLLALVSNAEASTGILSAEALAFVENNCLDCHNAGTQEGNIRLDAYDALGIQEQKELLNKIEEQVYLEQMPPEDEDQPTPKERQAFMKWIDSQYLALKTKSLFKDKLRSPGYGNYVNHEKLFSGQIKETPYTPSRRWLVSPNIFMGRVNDIFRLEGRQRQKSFFGVNNPFILPDHSGVRYFDNKTLERGHLLVMLSNAEWIANKQLWALAAEAGPESKNQNAASKPSNLDHWHPPHMPEAFETIALKESTPTDQEMTSAIVEQFDAVLRRRPSDKELKKYLSLFRSIIDAGGNTVGLRKMMVCVLLETEFLYRQEFGAGEKDEHGRKKLSPREASYAIAYALSDRGPDDLLRRAAKERRLSLKEDYRREVLRLLDDKKNLLGAIAPARGSRTMSPLKVTHPKINRFFRDFFGYSDSIPLFKDAIRFDGVYDNVSESLSGTGAVLSNEADKVIDHVLKQDKDVFEQLLTTDRYFVYHKYSNEQSKQIVGDWKKFYDLAKEKNWKENPEQFIKDHFESQEALFFNIRIKKTDKKSLEHNLTWLNKHMDYFDHTFGKGITPFSVISSHGNRFSYSSAYSLPLVAGHIAVKGIRDRDNWDYPVEQPFKVVNRMGILTHPAWLIAHSSNTHTDPVKRGKWIREKLLAGHVPDVPITVDAKIPEDHDKTIRERFGVTEKQECWKCHLKMNPLGYAFENFDDFGRYRTKEILEHPENLLTKSKRQGVATLTLATYKTKTLNTKAMLSGTGDPNLDGEVTDSFDLIGRLAKSDRVRQSIIRHAFRYFMGRNEMLSDSQTLIDADNAYVESGGSFRAVIVSLLTSDSFMYRK